MPRKSMFRLLAEAAMDRACKVARCRGMDITTSIPGGAKLLFGALLLLLTIGFLAAWARGRGRNDIE